MTQTNFSDERLHGRCGNCAAEDGDLVLNNRAKQRMPDGWAPKLAGLPCGRVCVGGPLRRRAQAHARFLSPNNNQPGMLVLSAYWSPQYCCVPLDYPPLPLVCIAVELGARGRGRGGLRGARARQGQEVRRRDALGRRREGNRTRRRGERAPPQTRFCRVVVGAGGQTAVARRRTTCDNNMDMLCPRIAASRAHASSYNPSKVCEDWLSHSPGRMS